MEHRNAVAVIVIVLIAVMLAGETLVYNDPYEYGSSIQITDGEPRYAVSSSSATEFTVTQFVSDGMEPPDEFYVYYDEVYGMLGITKADVAVGDVVQDLAIHGVDAAVVDADGLLDLMSREGHGVGVVFLTGALPSTVYTGAGNDPFLIWLSSGGSVYWTGPTLGKYVAWSDGSVTEVDGWEELFYGEGCFNDSAGRESAAGPRNVIGEALCIMGSSSQYGMSIEVEGCLQLGYVSDSGYGSAALAPFGSGMVCIIGGSYDDYTRTDMVQIAASGVTYCSQLILNEKVDVNGGQVTGSLKDVECSYVYIYCGGYYSPYGQRHTL